jgi:nitroreductase
MGEDRKMTSDQSVVPTTKISVYQAIYRRRMAWKYKDAPVSREVIRRMLDAAVWAPNHRLTEPWRFFVVEKGSRTRERVAQLAYDTSMERTNNPVRAQATRQAVLDPAYIVYVYCVPGQNEETTRENYAAVCCAAQNISLAGVAEGLAVTWETGGPTRSPRLKETLGAEQDWSLAVMLSIGVPGEDAVSRRTPATQFVRWLD